VNLTGTQTLGGLIGLLIGYVSTRYGWNVSSGEANAWGALAGLVGGTVVHISSTVGLWPALKRAIMGPPKPIVVGAKKSGAAQSES